MKVADTNGAGDTFFGAFLSRMAGLGIYKPDRLSPEQLLSGAERNRYIVLLDHQPHDFDAEAAAGADLVLSGHTHGGQFIPVRHVGEWVGENALRYGHERRGNTDFVVSSGISNWTLQFKTGCRSEIVLIHIQPA